MKILQFWSGGADSTYLLLQNLAAGDEVTCTYIDIENNEFKTKRELVAQEKLKGDIEKFCTHFKFSIPTYNQVNRIDIYPDEVMNGTQHIVLSMFALLLSNGYDEVHLGIVHGDDAEELTFSKNLVRLYRKEIGKCCNIVTPINKVSKEAVYLTLKGYDDCIGTHFIEHITCCEGIEEEVCRGDYLCRPCSTQRKVFSRLGWIKEEVSEINVLESK